eukprot:gb/GECG01003044.1/.p1 GENE.gb/GECG01003044.1/~~gb/GECG01003044.1/.p1  ORF type:complete len:718 (+),score=59.89 gb/GECG01003044.1/:1-2154(+)
MASNHLCSPVYGVFQAQKMTSEQHTLPSTIRTSESSNPIPELRYTTGGSGTDTWTASERLRVLGLLRRLTSHRGSHDTSGSTIGLAWPAYRMLKTAILSGQHDSVMKPLLPWAAQDTSLLAYNSDAQERFVKDLKTVLKNILAGDAAGIGTRIQRVLLPSDRGQIVARSCRGPSTQRNASWYDDSPDPASTEGLIGTSVQIEVKQEGGTTSHPWTSAASARSTGPSSVRVLDRTEQSPEGTAPDVYVQSRAHTDHTPSPLARTKSAIGAAAAYHNVPVSADTDTPISTSSSTDGRFYASEGTRSVSMPSHSSAIDLPYLEASVDTTARQTQGLAPFGATITTQVQRHVDTSQVSLKPSLGSENYHEPTYNANGSDMSKTDKSSDYLYGVSFTGGRHNMFDQRLNDVTILYYATDMREVAKRVASLSKGTVILHETQFGKFADGFPDIFLENVKDVRYNRVAYLASLHKQEDLFEQLSILYTLPRYGALSFTAIVPWFPTGTMERIDKVGQVATAKTLARMLSMLPPSATGPPQLVMLDVHALQELFYFSDSILVRPKSCVHLLIDRLLQLEDVENIAIAFPDEGAYKRFHAHFDAAFPTIVCAKRRENDSRHIVINEGDPKGKHVVIVDDLIQTGGTLLQCARALTTRGATKISAYVTHGVFPNQSWRKFLPSECGNLFEYFWITDSIPTTAREVENRPPFEILSIAETVSSLLAER